MNAAGVIDFGKIVYSLDGTNYSEDLPKATNAGTYTVYYRVDETDNYFGIAAQSFTVSIAKANLNATVSLDNWAYGETAKNPVVTGNTENGNVTYLYTGTINGGTSYNSATKPSDAGTYTVVANIESTTNYNAATTAADEFTINRAEIKPTITLEDWNYDYSPNTPVVTGNTGNGTQTITYYGRANNGTYYAESTTAPSNAGSYTVKVAIAQTNNYLSGSATNTFKINKLDEDYQSLFASQKPTSKSGLTYTGDSKVLANEPTNPIDPHTYSIYYALSDNNPTENTVWSSTIPSGKDAGDYKIWFKYVADKRPGDIGNITDVPNPLESITVTIAKADIQNPSVEINGWTYGSTASTPAPGTNSNPGNGTVTYEYKVKGADDATYTTTVPTNAGTYTVKATISATTNYNGATATKDFTIAKVTPTVNAPSQIEGLKYTGSEQVIVNAATTNYGKVLYSLDGTNYSEDLPKATNAGTYTVYYKVNEGDNNNAVAAQSVQVVVDKANGPDLTNVLTPTYESESGKLDGKISGVDETMEYSNDGGNSWHKVSSGVSELTGLEHGSYLFRKVGDINHYPSAVVTVTIGIKDTPLAPLSPVGVNAIGTASDGKITGVDNTMEYSADGGNTWTAITGVEIENLSPGDYLVRTKANNLSNPSYAATVTVGIDKVDQEGPKAENMHLTFASSNDAQDGKVAGVDNTMEYSADGGNTWTAIEGETIDNLKVGDYLIRKAETTYLKPSEAISVTMEAKAAAQSPSALGKIDTTDSTENDGVLSGLNDSMEYSIDGGNTWTRVPTGTTKLENLPVGTVLVRYAETDTTLPSAPVAVEIKAGLVVYSAYSGAGQDWTRGSKLNGRFVFKRNVNDHKTFDAFAGLVIDGKDVDSNNYELSSGSVIVALKPAFLNRLSVGTHTLTAKFNDGDDVTISFNIKDRSYTVPNTSVDNPNAVNNFGLLALEIMLGLSIITLTSVLILKRRQNKESTK